MMKGGFKDRLIRIIMRLDRARDFVEALLKYTVIREIMVRGYD